MKKRVWDLPTRLFHWAFAVVITAQFVTASLGGEAMWWHVRGGYLVLILVLFRVLWGFFGSEPSRFRAFVTSPAHMLDYARRLISRQAPVTASHNPLGGAGVLLMLSLAGGQAMLGLFSNDDILIEGPLMPLITKALSDQLTGWHGLVGQLLLLVIAIHLVAVIYHQWVLRERIVEAMIHGRKALETEQEFQFKPLWQAVLALVLAGLFVLVLISLGDMLGTTVEDDYY